MAKRTADSGAGGATPATRVLTTAGVAYTAHAFAADDRSRQSKGGKETASRLSFGVEAAEALGVETERVFKTLVAEIDGGLWVAVVPVSAQLDLKALATAAGGKRAAMADPAQAERSSGYVVGGISPSMRRSSSAVAGAGSTWNWPART
jgi:Cys-tRNA(Pro)/Cys-tRNA(Cys) deacylase